VTGATATEAPSVSVVIPTHNRAEMCVRAVESALNQTSPAMEIIVCDDHSTDSTRASLELLSANNERVSYLRRDSGKAGPGATRNLGITAANGDLVAFLDDDDEWLPEKLERQLPAALNGDGVVCSNALRSSGAPYFEDTLNHVITRDEISTHNPIILSSSIIPRKALAAVGGFSESSWLSGVEDYELWLRLADGGIAMTRIGDPLLNYADAGDDRLSARSLRNECALASVFFARWLRAPSDRRQLSSCASRIHGSISEAGRLISRRRQSV